MTNGAKDRSSIFRGLVAVATSAAMLAFAVPAFANAPNPDTTTVDQVVVNSDGSRTVTVEGTWTWASQSNCSTARNGVGYQIDWFDNTTNAIGSSKSPNGVLYVGDAQDNIVHSVETLGGSSALGNAFFDGVPSSYLTHNASSPAPTQTDVKNWLSQCPGVNSSGVTAGNWGPISHTYPASFTGPIRMCPILYDPHGGHDNSGQSSLKDIIAGGNGHNDDNSYEGNGTGANGNSCPTINVPTLSTTASSATAPNAIHDTAALAGSKGAGTITFKLYQGGSGCSGAPLFTSSASTNGDGDYQSGDFSPTTAGTYQWQASYSSSTITNLLSKCNDPAEQSVVTQQPPHNPAIQLVKLERIGSAAFTHGPITGNVGDTVDYEMQVTNTGDTPLDLAFTDAQCDSGTLSAPSVVTGNYTSGSQTLAPNGEIQYTCAHVLASGDRPYTNTASVVGTPPPGEGSPVNAQDSVQASAQILPPPANPAIQLVKLERIGSASFRHGPITGNVGDTVDYEMLVTNTGNTPLDLVFTDAQCDSGTLSAPSVVSGTYTAGSQTLAPAGELRYTCTHVLASGDQPFTNTASVTGTPPHGSPVSAQDSVQAFANTPSNPSNPGIKVLKLQRDGDAGSFTTSLLTISEHAGNYVVHTIEYEIQVTNTGNTPLTLSLNDPRCDRGTVQGPAVISGTLTGDVLAPGGQAQYTCSHRLLRTDAATFTNTATVTGTPPTGAPVHGTSSVTAKKRTVEAKKVCRTPSGRIVHYTGKHKPAACTTRRPPHHHPSRPPKNPQGFTG